jgi:hypothetical protein
VPWLLKHALIILMLPRQVPPLRSWICTIVSRQEYIHFLFRALRSLSRSSLCLALYAFSSIQSLSLLGSTVSELTLSSSQGQRSDAAYCTEGILSSGKAFTGIPIKIWLWWLIEYTIVIYDDIANGARLLHKLVEVLLHFTLIFIRL